MKDDDELVINKSSLCIFRYRSSVRDFTYLYNLFIYLLTDYLKILSVPHTIITE